MDKELIKKKNSLMKSILSNPKLARTIREAISSPIGSTKRVQAKSVLSIMRKLGGIKQDGMGGPENGVTQDNPQSGPPDYSNLMIFPETDNFKIAIALLSGKTYTAELHGDNGDGVFDPQTDPLIVIGGKTFSATFKTN